MMSSSVISNSGLTRVQTPALNSEFIADQIPIAVPAASQTTSSAAVIAEQLSPLRGNVSDVIRSVDDEVIDESEDERAAHAGGDDPAAEPGPPSPQGQADERPGQDDDVDEERRQAADSGTWRPACARPCAMLIARWIRTTAASACPLVISIRRATLRRV